MEGGSDLGKQLLRHLGPTLNAFHSVFVAFVCALLANVIASQFTQQDEEKGKYTWVGLKLMRDTDLQHFGMKLLGSLLIFILLAVLMTSNIIADFRRDPGGDLDVYDVSGLTLQVGALGGGERSRLQLPSGGSFFGRDYWPRVRCLCSTTSARLRPREFSFWLDRWR